MDRAVTTETAAHTTTLTTKDARPRVQPRRSSAATAGRNVAARVTATTIGPTTTGNCARMPTASPIRPTATSSRQLHCATRSSQAGMSPRTDTLAVPVVPSTSSTAPVTAVTTAIVGTATNMPVRPPIVNPIRRARRMTAGWSWSVRSDRYDASRRCSTTFRTTTISTRKRPVGTPPSARPASSRIPATKRPPMYGMNPAASTSTASGPASDTPIRVRTTKLNSASTDAITAVPRT